MLRKLLYGFWSTKYGKARRALVGSALLALVVPSNAQVGIDGTVGQSVSSGVVTVTMGGLGRRVGIFGLRDAVQTPSSGRVSAALGFPAGPGVEDRFCVVNTAGGAVKLTFLSAGGSTNSNLFSAVSTSGSRISYLLSVGPLANEDGVMVATDLGSTGVTIPAGTTRLSEAACIDPNARKSIIRQNSAQAIATDQVTYIDTVTVVATPV